MLELRLNGDPDADLAVEHGVTVAAIGHQARKRGMRKSAHRARGAGVRCPIRLVHSAVGKRARAEPVAALHEQGRATHAGRGRSWRRVGTGNPVFW